jgi:hypothetical protein
MREELEEWYESLKGTRTINGELKINGFDREMYEDLYYELLEVLKPYILNVGDFNQWYRKTVTQYIRYRQATNRRYDTYIPQMEPIEHHTLGEQLAVFKFFIYRRGGTGSQY